MRDKLKRFLWTLVQLVIRAAIAGTVSWWVHWWAAPAAYTQRGYEAVGGEWVLILFAFAFSFWFVGIFFRREVEA